MKRKRFRNSGRMKPSLTKHTCCLFASAVLVIGSTLGLPTAYAQEVTPAVEKPAPPVRSEPVAAKISAAEQKIYAALSQPTEMQFIDVPFSDVILSLSDKHGIPICIDTRALDGVGIGSEYRVTFQLAGVPLRTALQLMLRPVDLHWTVRDEILLITTYDEMSGAYKLRTYPVDDLVGEVSPLAVADHDKVDPDALVQAVQACIDLRDRFTVRLSVLKGNLIVYASDQTHFDVQSTLTGLREARHLLATDPQAAFARPIALSARSRGAGYQRIEAELEHKTQLEFIEVSLSDVFLHLAERHKIPILLDDRALDGVGISSDTPITQSLKGLSLRATLNLMLKELELTWVIEDGVLVITTIEEAESQWLPVGYVVRDLADLAGSTVQDYDRLIETVTSTAAPETWSENSQFDGVVFEAADLMIFTQSPAGQREIAGLFASLRQSPALRQWSIETYTADWEAYRTTPTLQRFYFAPLEATMPTWGNIEPEQVRTFVQRAFSEDDLEQRSFHFGEECFSMFMTPAETLDLLRKFDQAKISISHSDPFLPGGFHGGGFF